MDRLVSPILTREGSITDQIRHDDKKGADDRDTAELYHDLACGPSLLLSHEHSEAYHKQEQNHDGPGIDDNLQSGD